jgi:hypothetical protein
MQAVAAVTLGMLSGAARTLPRSHILVAPARLRHCGLTRHNVFIGVDRAVSQEYYSFLARTIIAARQNPAELTPATHQFARAQLRQELFKNDNQVSLAEAKQQIAALETAIEQIELNVRINGLLGPPGASEDEMTCTTDITALTIRDHPSRLPARRRYTSEVLPPIDYSPPMAINETYQEMAAVPADGRDDSTKKRGTLRAGFWSTLQLVMAAILAVTIFSSLQDESLRNFVVRHVHAALGQAGAGQKHPADHSHAPAVVTGAAINGKARIAPVTASLDGRPGVPLPTFFGVYAVARGRLTNLAPLPITVPNPRVQISALFSTPSAATLPDGRLQFVAFRSDLAGGAPDHTTVRVVAQVMQALTFDKQGHPKTTDVHGSWAVRGIAYEMRIAPVNAHPDMVLIQPADPNFTFSPGRYALVLKNSAYDFSVAGRIADPAHCLERTDAVNEPVYNECPRP